jgi:hypothetical protein
MFAVELYADLRAWVGHVQPCHMIAEFIVDLVLQFRARQPAQDE